MAQKSTLKKATFSLSINLLKKLRHLAASKRIPSTNAAVREALERYLESIEKDMIFGAQWKQPLRISSF